LTVLQERVVVLDVAGARASAMMLAKSVAGSRTPATSRY
jgi:hypothetical protein